MSNLSQLRTTETAALQLYASIFCPDLSHCFFCVLALFRADLQPLPFFFPALTMPRNRLFLDFTFLIIDFMFPRILLSQVTCSSPPNFWQYFSFNLYLIARFIDFITPLTSLTSSFFSRETSTHFSVLLISSACLVRQALCFFLCSPNLSVALSARANWVAKSSVQAVTTFTLLSSKDWLLVFFFLISLRIGSTRAFTSFLKFFASEPDIPYQARSTTISSRLA
mmetsp:Transcript_43630/g.86568  ORF Transcript_43630/g.86568 Transcript_43630/m.86568 type:complete len:224 (-) Transcript_43630:240-911(-)